MRRLCGENERAKHGEKESLDFVVTKKKKRKKKKRKKQKKKSKEKRIPGDSTWSSWMRERKKRGCGGRDAGES